MLTPVCIFDRFPNLAVPSLSRVNATGVCPVQEAAQAITSLLLLFSQAQRQDQLLTAVRSVGLLQYSFSDSLKVGCLVIFILNYLCKNAIS